jgi:hypothetical protein
MDFDPSSRLILRIVTTRVHVVFQSWAVNKRFFRSSCGALDLIIPCASTPTRNQIHMAGTCARRRSLTPRRWHNMMSPMYSILLALMCDIIEAVVAAFVTVSAAAATVFSSGIISSTSYSSKIACPSSFGHQFFF